MSTLKYYFSDKIIEHLNFKLLYVNHMKYEGKWEYQYHSHNFTQLFYFIDGKGAFILDGTPYPIKANDFVIINPHIVHKKQSDPKYKLEYVVFAIEGLSFQFGTGLSNHNYGVYSYDKYRDKFLLMIDMMLREAASQIPGYELVCNDIAEMLVLNIARSQGLGITCEDNPEMSKEVCIAKGFIDSHYMESIDLGQLSDITHMNKYYLVHAFKKYVGDTPMNYLQQKRIQVAEQLLRTTNHSVSLISTNVGFSSQSYFAQVFKKAYGTTPVQYRKEVGLRSRESQ